MSERLKTTNQISNEEIIDDLTKDLEIMKAAQNVEEPGAVAGTSAEGTTSGSGDAAKFTDIPLKKEKDIKKEKNETHSSQDFNEEDVTVDYQSNNIKNEPKDFDDDFKEDEDKNDESDTDSIDIEVLKNLEVEQTEQQLEERKAIAEELKETGNYGYKIQDYDWCLQKYTQGLDTCPLKYPRLRAVLYANRSAVRMKQLNYKKAIRDCTRAIELDDQYIKAYVRRAMSYEATEKLDESLADFKKVLELDPSNAEAKAAMTRLPPLIEEKNEKLKTEMFGKLKDLGNMILKPFGLSTENFKMEQDPETKGYKINFKQ